MNTFSIGEMIRFGWETFKKRPWALIGMPLLAGLVSFILNTAIGEVAKFGIGLGVVAFFANFAVQSFYGVGMANFFLKAERDTSSVQLQDFWHPAPFWRYVGMSIVLMALGAAIMLGAAAIAGAVAGISHLVLAGTAQKAFLIALVPLAILAAAYLGTVFFPTQYAVVATSRGPVEAVRAAYAMTKGKRLKIFLFILALIGLNILGAIALIVGLLVTMPVSALASVRLYRNLESATPATPTA